MANTESSIDITFVSKTAENSEKCDMHQEETVVQDVAAVQDAINGAFHDLFAIRTIMSAYIEIVDAHEDDYITDREGLEDTMAYVDQLTEQLKTAARRLEVKDPNAPSIVDFRVSNALAELSKAFGSGEFKYGFRDILVQLEDAIENIFLMFRVERVTGICPDTGKPVTVYDAATTTVRSTAEHLFRLRYLLASPAWGDIVWTPGDVSDECDELVSMRDQITHACVRLMHTAPEQRTMSAEQYDQFMRMAPLALVALDDLIANAAQCMRQDDQARWEQICDEPKAIAEKELIIALEYVYPDSPVWIIDAGDDCAWEFDAAPEIRNTI